MNPTEQLKEKHGAIKMMLGIAEQPVQQLDSCKSGGRQAASRITENARNYAALLDQHNK